MGEVRGWGPWTQGKLSILERYLQAFASASSTLPERIYLDAFAGEGVGVNRLTGDEFDGSARRALGVQPPFTRVRLFEKPLKAERLRAEIHADFPGRDIDVKGGDSNLLIPRCLERLKPYNWAPTFAFLDPDGMQVSWATLEAIAGFRQGKTKAEMWILFPGEAVPRAIAARGQHAADEEIDLTTRLFGTEAWQEILHTRAANLITAAQARRLYVNLMRWRLHAALHYEWVHTLEIRNTLNRPVYQMLFSTDHPAGDRIMTSLYRSAEIELPVIVQRAKDQRKGQGALFDREASPPPKYQYAPPEDPEVALRGMVAE